MSFERKDDHLSFALTALFGRNVHVSLFMDEGAERTVVRVSIPTEPKKPPLFGEKTVTNWEVIEAEVLGNGKPLRNLYFEAARDVATALLRPLPAASTPASAPAPDSRRRIWKLT